MWNILTLKLCVYVCVVCLEFRVQSSGLHFNLLVLAACGPSTLFWLGKRGEQGGEFDILAACVSLARLCYKPLTPGAF